MTDPIDTAVQTIARRVLQIETLEERGRDHLDFHDCSVSLIREALEQAYRAGADAGRTVSA